MMSRFQPLALAIIVGIVAVVAGMLLSRQLMPGNATALASGTLLEPARPLPAMDFVDQRGAAFGPERLRGRWSLMFFGFTSCPDICPATLHVLAQVEKLVSDLPPERRPQIVLVSVDPQRDTPAQLAAYVEFFSPSFTGVTGKQEAVDEFARQMGVPVAITRLDSDGYTVDHSAAIFLINPAGEMRALFSTPHTPELIADDYRRVVGS
jgi:protein SCO1/2